MLLDIEIGIASTLMICSLSAVALFIHFWYRIFRQATFSKDLPWAGTRDNEGRIARMKATLASIGKTRDSLIEGYHKVGSFLCALRSPHRLKPKLSV